MLEVRHEALHKPKERARLLLTVRGERGPGQRQLGSREKGCLGNAGTNDSNPVDGKWRGHGTKKIESQNSIFSLHCLSQLNAGLPEQRLSIGGKQQRAKLSKNRPAQNTALAGG